MDVLRALGVSHARCAVVAFSDDIGNSVLITLNLKELGIPRIVCKARSASHEELLRRIGADQVIFPEQESGRNLAHTLNNREILEYIRLSEHYSIVKTEVPNSWLGKAVEELEIRKQFKVTIVAIQSADGSLQTAPFPGYVFHRGDILFSLGKNEDNDHLIYME
jgi:trk system potassium uptake protein TrkA